MSAEKPPGESRESRSEAPKVEVRRIGGSGVNEGTRWGAFGFEFDCGWPCGPCGPCCGYCDEMARW